MLEESIAKVAEVSAQINDISVQINEVLLRKAESDIDLMIVSEICFDYLRNQITPATAMEKILDVVCRENAVAQD